MAGLWFYASVGAQNVAKARKYQPMAPDRRAEAGGCPPPDPRGGIWVMMKSDAARALGFIMTEIPSGSGGQKPPGARGHCRGSTCWETLVSSLIPGRACADCRAHSRGKSALALAIAARQGGLIVNADALQVYDCWRVISARPSAAQGRRRRPMPSTASSGRARPGRWADRLRAVADLQDRGQRLIVVGGPGRSRR